MGMIEQPSARLVITLVLAVLAASVPSAEASNRRQPAAQRTFEYPRGADTIVVQLSRAGGITDADETPLLRIYGDGRALVHFPAYMRQAGDYALQLGDGEMEDLISALVESGLMEFDPAVTSSQLRALQASQRDRAVQRGQPGTLSFRSDETTTSIEVRLERYRPARGNAEVFNPMKRITWRGLQSQAERFPEIPQLDRLAGVERRLLNMTERPDLVRARE